MTLILPCEMLQAEDSNLDIEPPYLSKADDDCAQVTFCEDTKREQTKGRAAPDGTHRQRCGEEFHWLPVFAIYRMLLCGIYHNTCQLGAKR